MKLTIDCSVMMALCFEDESSQRADRMMDSLGSCEAVVPAIWWFEVRNVLVVNERRGRITPGRSAEFLAVVNGLPFSIDHDPVESVVLALARHHGLTIYDAAYLEVAKRRGCVLCTLDLKLERAAVSAGVNVWE